MSGSNKQINVLVSGGGTGGHIFPALSIANEVHRRHPEWGILFVGAEGRMEMEKVPAAGYKIIGLPVSGFDRKRLWRNFAVGIKLLKSMVKANNILKDFKPDIAIGVGGYASGPMLKAAQKQGIPTLLQEQNSFAGVTNKLLAAKAERICVAYEGMERFFPKEKIVLTGNPVRRNLLECGATPEQARQAMGMDPAKKTILIIGGSLGARTVNNAVMAGLKRIGETYGVQVIWQTGKIYDQQCREALEASGVKNVAQMPFISNMDMAYRAADLVVSRAGASSISELQLLGKAAILVPSPNVAEDHQTKNALALVNRDAAMMVTDADAAEHLVGTMLDTVMDSEKTASLGRNVLQMALRDAAEHIVDEVEKIIESNNA
ncbi:MAG: undecaprenyldiphospho-muramoylpentapeptide beta-N-acetylglucosaminyltransferase [Muribaculaceae bacterium]|jgi:UDP-N-acetylglucosamine--N-acetylmuramyl-(pentapeptide) pyrophosphoryl-undecaprenol N-acetylglucosamine transferase|nr:undecaprenyldiphospho-muramoylpentapeptide beta-N-acetylglucosaminyltransferase [Muribaculaceae bacterium]MBQ7205790.1 undecaprenyldiphospho-muramoylpentapeptide beta-N-acetylglucosaminyltransferase [Muribaculaceae bacterium]